MTTKPKATKEPTKQSTQNTSAAPVPGNTAEVSATVAVQAATQAVTSQAGQLSSDVQGIPPAGEEKGGDSAPEALIVSAKVEGFRRAGRRWTVEAQTVPVEAFTAEQVEALLSEPMLDVTVVAG